MKVIRSLFSWLKWHRGFASIVVLPMLVATVYLSWVATDRYVSSAMLVVKKAGLTNEVAPTGLNAILGGVTSQNEDVHYLREFLHSADALATLDKELNLRAIYADPDVDFFHRMPEDATKEEFLAYFRARTQVTLNENTGILSVSVQAYHPEDTLKINRRMLTLSESYINNLSYQIVREQTVYMEKEIVGAKARMEQAKEKLIAFQNEHNLLSPVQEAQAASQLTAQFEAELSRLNAELKNVLAYMNPDAPQVVGLRHRISAVRSQLAQERARITSGGAPKGKDGRVLNELSSEYADLEYQAQFATQVYQSTVTAMEQLRVEIAQKLKSVVLVTVPQLPEEPEFPKTTGLLLKTLGILLLIYFAIRLIVATIEDHRED